jgi:hypothetical protein
MHTPLCLTPDVHRDQHQECREGPSIRDGRQDVEPGKVLRCDQWTALLEPRGLSDAAAGGKPLIGDLVLQLRDARSDSVHCSIDRDWAGHWFAVGNPLHP